MPRLLTVICLALLLSGCGMYGYGPERDYSKFVSTASTPDGRLGVFSHHNYVYRPATGWRAFPDGGIPYYVKDTNVLGVIDMHTGEVSVASREKNRYFQPGQGEFFVSHISNGKAVISQFGQKRSDYMTGGWWYMLDLATGNMEKLALREELAKMGRGMGYMYLTDDAGTLALVTPPADAPSGWVGKESNVKEVYLRHPDGTYEHVAGVIHYYPTRDGLVHYYAPEGRYLVYDPETRSSRTPPDRYPPSWDESSMHNLAISPSDNNRLSFVVWHGDNYEYRDAGVDAEELY